MPPDHVSQTTSYRDRYPTPEDLPATRFWVDSPLDTKRVASQRTSPPEQASRPPHHPPQNGKPKPSPPVGEPSSRPANGKKQELRFFNVTDPKELKDRRQLRLNRQHVMHTFLEKERQKPSGQRDVRVDGVGAAIKRKRSRIQVTAPFAPGPPRNGSAEREDLSTPASSCYSHREGERRETPPRRTPDQPKKIRQADPSHGRDSQQLVPGLNGTWKDSRYMQTDWQDVPFLTGSVTSSEDPDSTVGSSLNPFDTWPAFSDASINVSSLKYSCSRRFGSLGIAQYWVPELLRARHAFLSTICISSAHDDIMARARRPDKVDWLATREGVERLRVRSEVIGMVNASLDDEEARTSDATIISVLHLLNSEVMGCDDRVMKTHQDGLHRMVRQRGGLDGLGVKGQLASILVITMYMISVLRESPPHHDFAAYASKHAKPLPLDPRAQLPESPIYCRPSGYETITARKCPSRETWVLLNALREITRHFLIVHNPGFSSVAEDSRAQLRRLRDEVFSLPPSHNSNLSFPDLNARYTYETLRLTSLLYAHALHTQTPFSVASANITSGSATSSTGQWPPGISATQALHVQICNAVLKTDCSSCWGALAGVLFFVALVAGAGANPGALANAEREGEEEDARKVMAAIAVRCSIVLSFEFGEAVLSMLRGLVGIEAVLNDDAVGKYGGGGLGEALETWKGDLWTSEPGVGIFVDGVAAAGPELPPVSEQLLSDRLTPMGDFAWDFEGCT